MSISYCIALVFISPSLTYAQELHEKTIYEITKHTSSEQNPHITVGNTPLSIGVDTHEGYQGSIYGAQHPSTIYVANTHDGTVSVIDGRNNTKIGSDIKVGRFPYAIAVNSYTGTIYVVHEDQHLTGPGRVSVINGTTHTKIEPDIKVGRFPMAMAVIENTFGNGKDTIYVANTHDSTVSVIDGKANKVVAKVMFNTEPFDAGHIECDKLIAPTAQQFYVWSGSKCIAKPNQGFEFVSWQENLEGNSTQLLKFSPPPSIWEPILDLFHMNFDKPEATLNITKFGSFTANFKPLPSPIRPEYVATLFTVVATAFIGSFLTPTIIGWRKAKKEGRRVQTHHLVIKSLYDDGKIDEKDIPSLDKLKDDIMDDYANGNISEQHYNNLNNTISVPYEEIYKKKIDLFKSCNYRLVFL